MPLFGIWLLRRETMPVSYVFKAGMKYYMSHVWSDQRLRVESSTILVVVCSCYRLISRLQPCSNVKSLGQALQVAWHKHSANHVVFLHSAAPAVRWKCRGMTMSLNLRMVWTEKHKNFLVLFPGLHHFQSLITCSEEIWRRKALGA